MAITRVEVLDTIFTTTFYKRRKELIDQVFSSWPLFKWLTGKGKIKERPGGLALEIPITTGKNTTTKFLSRGDTIAITDTEIATMATYYWKFAASSIVRYWHDDVKQSANNLVLANYVTTKIDNARDSLTEMLENALTVHTGNPNDVDGLSHIITTNPAIGVLGSIDRAANAYWRNKAMVASGPADIYLTSDLEHLYNDCGKGRGGYPDFHIMGQNVYELYVAEIMEESQIVNQGIKDLGFTGVVYKGSPVEWSEFIPSGLWYMINSKFLEIAISDNAAMELTEWKAIPNQVNDRVAQVTTCLQMFTSSPKKLGVLSGIA